MTQKLPKANCDDCPLQHCEVVPGFGPLDSTLIIVGEAPGAAEAMEGFPFVGPSGMLLDAALAQCDPNPDVSVYKTNVVACRPPGNREPTDYEVACCAPRLDFEVSCCSAQKILALGNVAQGAFNIPSNQRGAIFSRGGRAVMGAWHPAYILRSPDEASVFLAQVAKMVTSTPESLLAPPPWPEVRIAKSAAELEGMLSKCPDDAWVAWDIETDNVQWYSTNQKGPDGVLMMQFLWDPTFGVVVDDAMLYDVPAVKDILQKFFSRVRIVGHNVKFDAVFTRAHFGIDVYQSFDTMLAHYALDENQPHGLKEIAKLELGIPDYEVETIGKYLSTRNDRYSKVPFDDLAKYGCMDVLVTWLLRERFSQRLVKEGLYDWPFKNVLMVAANKLVDVEIAGFQVDVHHLDIIAAELQTKMDDLAQQIRQLGSVPDLNPNSTVQMADLLYDRLHLPIVRGRKIKPRSTASEALAKLKDLHPIIGVIQEYRRVAKMKSSYADNLRGYVDTAGAVHATFRIQGTEVGRLSVANPALQTIPRASDSYGALIRSAFIATPGNVLIICDYSQAELRVFAALSSEPFLLQVYLDGRDLHSEVAKGMFGEAYTKEQRVRCKMFNFSYLYGGTEFSFAQDAGLPIDIARQFVAKYNELMPVGLEYKRAMLRQLRTVGYVQSRFGRRRHFPLIVDGNLEEARKACVHMPVASAASDITLLSAAEAIDGGIDVRLTVHDSVIAQSRPEVAEETGSKLSAIMMRNGEKYFPEVKWKVDTEVRNRWADLHPSQ